MYKNIRIDKMSKNDDIVYIYPKSSCKCYDCSNKCDDNGGFQSNMHLSGCSIPNCLDCIDKTPINMEIYGNNGKLIINPQVYEEKRDKSFERSDDNCVGSYTSIDPRLYSTIRRQRLDLDSAPIVGSVRLNELYTPSLDNYGTKETPYKDIRDGQIIYYLDKSLSTPFHNNVYSHNQEYESVIYKDPMGGIQTEFTRKYGDQSCPINLPDSYDGCLSFIQDSTMHREDLMSLQSRNMLKSDWSVRWPEST